MLWEAIFMLVILKIPVVYLCAVVWWAIRAEPRPLQGAARTARLDLPPDCNWQRRSLRPRVRPRPGGGGRLVPAGRVALVRATAKTVAR